MFFLISGISAWVNRIILWLPVINAVVPGLLSDEQCKRVIQLVPGQANDPPVQAQEPIMEFGRCANLVQPVSISGDISSGHFIIW